MISVRAGEVVEAARAALTALPHTSAKFRALGPDLMPMVRHLGELQRLLDAAKAAGAAEVAAQSARELGMQGLAQREGARTPEKLIQQLTGVSGREARVLLRAGEVMHELETAENPDLPPVAGMPPLPVEAKQPWMAPIAALLREGSISADAADRIGHEIGQPDSTVDSSMLLTQLEKIAHAVRDTDARIALLELYPDAGVPLSARKLTVEQLGRLAKAARYAIDDKAVAKASADRLARQSLKVWKTYDGMIRIDGLLSPEHGGAEVLAVFEQALSPRRGGPRFVDPEAVEWSKHLVDDKRRTDQIAADVFIELIRNAAKVSPTEIIGHRQPAVRVLVTQQQLDTARAAEQAAEAARNGQLKPADTGGGTPPTTIPELPPTVGKGWLEGYANPIPMTTVEQEICNRGTVQVVIDGPTGSVLDVGRERRLFTQKQRVAIASRDGGCMAPDCDCDPSKCEFHHIDEWAADHGLTNVDNGICLCRFHHHWLHTHGWKIVRRNTAELRAAITAGEDPYQFLLLPPPTHANQTAIPLTPKSPAFLAVIAQANADRPTDGDLATTA